MKFHLNIECDNAAFTENHRAEIARILEEAARHIQETFMDDAAILDHNGNRVGSWEVTG